MKPLHLKLENFQSYRGLHELDLEPVDLAVLVGPNGAGKSTIIDAIRFAVWGATRSGLAEVVTRGEDSCLVDFSFALGPQSYMVSRRRSNKGGGKTALSFLDLSAGDLEPEVLDGRTVADTQALIDQTIGMTDDLFVATACASQGHAALFSTARPAERKALLGEILGLQRWEQRANAARAMSAELGTRLESSEARLQELQNEAARRGSYQERVRDLDAEIATARELLQQAKQELEDIREDRSRLQEEKLRAEALDGQIATVTESLSTLDHREREARARCDALQTQIKRRPEIEARIAEGTAAQKQIGQLENAREMIERLEAHVVYAQSRLADWKDQHQRRTLDAQAHLKQAIEMRERQRVEMNLRIAATQKTNEQRIASATHPIEVGEGLAQVLGEVPCGEDEAIWQRCQRCPLIAQAQEADCRLPALREELEVVRQASDREMQAVMDALQELDHYPPVAEAQAAVVAVNAEQVPNELTESLEAARGERAAVEFDQERYDAAVLRAETLEANRAALAGLAQVEGEISVILATMKRRQGDRHTLALRCEELTTQRSQMADEAAFDREARALAQREADAAERIPNQEQALRDFSEERGKWAQHLETAEKAAEEAAGLTADMQANRDRRRLLDLLGHPRRGAFSKAGIPALLIERSVPELEATANEVLGVMTDNRMALELRSQRETQAGKGVTETLDIVIYDQQGERPYETFSGGEAMRIDLAVRIALSTLLASRAGARCELLVLDETAAPLDIEGRDLFVEALSKVAERFATILVVTHVESLKDRFPCQIEVSRDVGGSQLAVTSS